MYLVVAEAEDGTWYDEGETAVGLDTARKVARGKWDGCLPRGYEVIVYSLAYVEHVHVDLQKTEQK